MAIKFSLKFPKRAIPWTWIVLLASIVGAGAMLLQLWFHGMDRPISEDTIRSQQLRLSASALKQVQDALSAYRAPSTSEALNSDPLRPTTGTSTTP